MLPLRELPLGSAHHSRRHDWRLAVTNRPAPPRPAPLLPQAPSRLPALSIWRQRQRYLCGAGTLPQTTAAAQGRHPNVNGDSPAWSGGGGGEWAGVDAEDLVVGRAGRGVREGGGRREGAYWAG